MRLARTAPGESRLLTDLLTDGPSEAVVHRHEPTRRSRETPAQRPFLAQIDTRRYGLERTHNPKVVGSNPTPATSKVRPIWGKMHTWSGLGQRVR